MLALTALVVVLSYWPVRNLFARRQLMNYAFNRLHLVGTYGAFGSVTRERYEVVLEGTSASVPAPGCRLARVRVQGQARRSAAPPAADRAVPPAPRLAHVVRRAVTALCGALVLARWSSGCCGEIR